MKLISIELCNFRAHKHLEFTPDPEGITVIRGVNGAGKSTIIEALTWCLYGSGAKPADVVKNADLIRYGATIKKGEDQCYVRAIVELFGETYRVTRRITNMRGSIACDLEKETSEGWEYVAGDSAKDVDPMIRKLVRLTREEFLTAVHIQQSKVNTIVDKSNKEARTRVMYGFMGVNGAVESIRLAREQARELASSIKSSTVTESTVSELEAKVEQLDSDYSTIVTKGKKLKDKAEAVYKNLQEATKVSRELSREYTRTMTLEGEQRSLNNDVKDITARISRVRKEREPLRDKQRNLNSAPYHLVQERYKKVAQEHTSIVSELSKVRQDIHHSEQSLQDSYNATENSDSDVSEVEVIINDLRERVISYGKVGENLLALKASKQSQGESIRQAIDVLETGDACPTCLQSVTEPSKAVEVLKSALETCRIEYKDASSHLRELDTKTESHNTTIKALEATLSHLNNIQALEPKMSELKALEGDLSAQLSIKQVELDSVRELLNVAEQIEDIKTREKKLKEDEISLTLTLDEKQKRLAEINENLKTVGKVTEAQVVRAQKKEDELSGTYHTLNDELTDLRVKASDVLSDKKAAQEKLKEEQKELHRYSKLLESHEKAVATQKTLEEYKQTLIDNAIPIVETYATELINGFTDGKFLKVEFDDTFLPTVYRSDGLVFPVTMLSGGEKQLAAIALRLASSLMLTNGVDQPLLEFDEITTSLDPDNTQRVLQVAKERAQGQIIIIDHKNDEVDNVADKIIEI